VYSRRVGDEVLSFGHEGLLYKRSFIMYDRSTRSLWLHVTGRAVSGKRKGQQLKFFSASVLKWGRWKKRFPQTVVLEGRFASEFMGAFNLEKRMDSYGLSVGEGADVKLYPFRDLKARPLVHDGDIVVAFLAKDAAARAFLRGGRTFKLDGDVLVDDEGKRWDWFTGWGLGGRQEKLESVPATAWRIDRWKGHFPKGRVHGTN
jgi:hypothetical protein